jgi:hypothetical protein
MFRIPLLNAEPEFVLRLAHIRHFLFLYSHPCPRFSH